MELSKEMIEAGFVYKKPDVTKMNDEQLNRYKLAQKISENLEIIKPKNEVASSIVLE